MSLKIQMNLDNPHIAKLYCIFNDKDAIYLLMELCIDGDLSDQGRIIQKDQHRVKKTAIGIMKGLSYLHMKNILHRDLKL